MGIEKPIINQLFRFFKMFRWNKRFERVGKPKFFQQQQAVLTKLLMIQRKKDLDSYFRQF